MVSIKSAAPLSGHRVEVQLNNGHSVTVDFTGKLHTVRFGKLKDEEFFRNFTVIDDFVIRWGRILEVSLNEVFELAQTSAEGQMPQAYGWAEAAEGDENI